MSTTGTGASFTSGTGAQYASPKAFKKRDEIGEPFTTPNPSIPNRKSKFIDYKKLFEKAFQELYNPIKNMTSSQANIGDNSGYDMNSQDVAEVVDDIAAKIKAEFNRYRTHIRKNYPEEYKRFQTNENINEARYSQFKTETKLRTPTEQIHRAVREIRRKIDEIVKVVGHTERMKSELKQSNEGMSYLKRTRNAINTISEKLQELNNRIKGLTE